MPVTVSVSPSPRTRPGRPDLPEIILHLGAHRTGSTRLQYLLDANRDALAAHATVALTPPRRGKRVSPTIRDVLALTPTGRYRPVRHYLKRRRARAMLRALIADRLPDRPPRRIILSDENMLGPGFRTDGFGLYPYAYPRLAALRRLLGRPPSAVHLTLRAYDTFLVSVYAMAAVYRRVVPPFDDIRETLLAVHRGWPDVVDDVARVFPGTAVKLTRVERDSMENRVRGLVGPELLKRFRFDGDERPNAAPTAEAMAAAAGSGGRTSPDDLVARYAHGARFDPLTEEERSRLARRYVTDLESLDRAGCATAS